jgi:hypothetical protein
VSQTTPRRPHLAHHDHRSTPRGGEPGTTPGGDSAIQRGRLNRQLFGQVTSQARHARHYDTPPGHLTNTEAPKGTDFTRYAREDLDAVAKALNERPRKTLGFKTPAEALNEHLVLAQNTGVATTA